MATILNYRIKNQLLLVVIKYKKKFSVGESTLGWTIKIKFNICDFFLGKP